ncbi:GNAT family N-acetyltransferase [Bacillus sp. RG28]|uniref:GNAT family N-acetyltransferase n=1 Tax=Gottfriedia endophytica TaxID=2820819 RepID=A0A940NTQ9_9BACI|nr:GNAT family N-acetyltransferase [Gottfriedia endophytica]MBP0726937.1 GNAT family N-acetyltransferase [Gottfriedia endophytica]
MEITEYKFTDRMKKVVQETEVIVQKYQHGIISPLHLFLGLINEKSGVCGELFLYVSENNKLRNLEELLEDIDNTVQKEHVGCSSFQLPLSITTYNLLENAEKRRNHYKQRFINEGHVFQAIFADKSNIVYQIFSENELIEMKNIVCTSRDLVVKLQEYNYSKIIIEHHSIQKATRKDQDELLEFIEKEFGSGWVESIKHGFIQNDIPIYLAKHQDKIQGFACYDVYNKQKGVFGPMGIAGNQREKGIGKALLHSCLYEMKMKGYYYAIIGEAGPIEFYEKNCGAILIPCN